jgi:hypothetical protein
MMERNLREGETAIRYDAKFREYGIPVLDGGSSMIKIMFCPWCGQKLPESFRDKWFEVLASKNLDLDDPAIPQDMLSDAWWKRSIRYGARV